MGAGAGRLICVYSTARGHAVSVARPRRVPVPRPCATSCGPVTHTHRRGEVCISLYHVPGLPEERCRPMSREPALEVGECPLTRHRPPG
eukprot:2394956-Prymnesium_polylepis.1